MKKFLMVLTVSFLFQSCGDNDNVTPNQLTIETAIPEDVGLDSKKLDEFTKHLNDVNVFSSVLIAKEGKLAYEYYSPNDDETELKKLRALTRFVTISLVGIAIDNGFINSIDDPMLDYFPEYEVTDDFKKNITINHLIQMRSGLGWGFNSFFNELSSSENKVKLALDQAMVNEPGGQFIPNTANIYLLSAAIESASDMNIEEFTKRYLFNRLGITDYCWKPFDEGGPNTIDGLWLNPTDLLKITLLYEKSIKSEIRLSDQWISNFETPVKIYPESPDFQDLYFTNGFFTRNFGFDRDIEVHYMLDKSNINQVVAIVPERNMTFVFTTDGIGNNFTWYPYELGIIDFAILNSFRD